MRCAIYARFSSDLQDARSITDQTFLCRERAERDGWTVVAAYSDAAISGATLHNRPGLLDCVMAAKEKKFDILLTESLDRLSRDLEDIAGLHKRFRFWGVKIVTLADGEVGQIHVGLKGLIASMFLEDLAMKTRRGHIGRLKAGRVPGSKLYGYDVVKGEEKGLRTINEAEAVIVRRIFAEYVTGRSPLKIVAGLNRDGVRAPFGGQWSASTISGSPKRQNGIISSRLYVGEIVYNRQRFVKDPATGRRTGIVNPQSEWLIQPAPQLAIVDRDLFDLAQIKRAEVGHRKLTYRRRPKHLLSGKVRCGCCGSAMIVVRNDEVGCSAVRNKGTCTNKRTIHLNEIETRVLAMLRSHLMAPEIVEAAIEAYRIERASLAQARARTARNHARDLAAVEAKIERVVRAIEDGEPSKALTQRLSTLEGEREAILAATPAPIDDNVLSLHPTAAKRYAEQVAAIAEALKRGDEAAQEAIELVRKLIDAITVTPTDDGGPMQLEVSGNLAAMLERPENGPRYQRMQAPATKNLYISRACPRAQDPTRLGTGREHRDNSGMLSAQEWAHSVGVRNGSCGGRVSLSVRPRRAATARRQRRGRPRCSQAESRSKRRATGRARTSALLVQRGRNSTFDCT